MERQTHATTIELIEPPPSDVPVGATFVVKLAARCADGCDLHDSPFHVAAPDGRGGSQHANSTADVELTLQAPRQVGDHVWRISLPPSRTAAANHAAEPLAIRVNVKPHTTSLAVWDIPSPAVKGQPFAIKAGAKSAGDIALSGRLIEVCDDTGAVLAQGCLGDAPWPGTSALYWIELNLPAPGEQGTHTWSVRFAATDVELPHDGAVSNFTVVVAPPAEHRLTVTVAEKDTVKPVGEAEIRLGVYRAITDPAGIATVAAPKGAYELVVWKVGYDIPVVPVEVDADRVVVLEATVVPEEDPDAIWTM